MSEQRRKKIICIGGATASGKSALAEKIALENNGVIISADSRQVYKNLEIFSGISESEKGNNLVGILDIWEDYSASDFVEQAEEKMKMIWAAGKIPIVVGGTSFYFKSLLYDNFFPAVGQNRELRDKMADKDAGELIIILEKLDIVRAGNIDGKNKPRIIRAIEIATELGKVPVVKDTIKEGLDIDFFWVHVEREEQKRKIDKNFRERMEKGFLEEAEKLKKVLEIHYKNEVEKTGDNDAVFSTQTQTKIQTKIEKRFYQIGLAYKHIFKCWTGEITETEFIEFGILEEQKYAKRQNTYLKKFFKELPDSVNKKEI